MFPNKKIAVKNGWPETINVMQARFASINLPKTFKDRQSKVTNTNVAPSLASSDFRLC